MIKRFISEDPIRMAAGPNYYAYALNNPVRYLDPSGLISFIAGVGIQMGIFGTGGEASAGLAATFPPGSMGPVPEVSTTVTVGQQVAGVIAATDLPYVGILRGGPETLQGDTININVAIPAVSATVIFDPNTGKPIGMTVGVGPGAGIQITNATTTISNLSALVVKALRCITR